MNFETLKEIQRVAIKGMKYVAKTLHSEHGYVNNIADFVYGSRDKKR